MVAVLSKTGKRLMPTTEYKTRKLLKNGKAAIYKYRPFTIKLTEKEDGNTQPIEYACDTGYQHIGISIKSESREYVNEQRDLLKDETEKHKKQKTYRRTRRNRKTRYRKPRWNNRRDNLMCKDGFAPSIRNKRDIHIQLFQMYKEVIPITSAIFEMGQFDTQVLKAIEEGKPLPQGKDYQQGERYGYATLREAVFARDNYRCLCCGRSAIIDGIMLRLHHLGYLIGDRSNRMSNLGSVCTDCHTSKNHKKGGKLYNLRPILNSFKGATFMTMVRWDMLEKLKDIADNVPVLVTYGAATKLKRKELGIKKTHSNDAYCMGEYHPKHRANFRHYQKRRRNNRVLSKFYDAKYIDKRDGSTKKGAQIGCNRTNRSEPRNSPKNERIYRGEKVSKGKIVVRRQHYQLRPGDSVWYQGTKHIVKGVKNNGKQVSLPGNRYVATSKIKKVVHINGWSLL